MRSAFVLEGRIVKGDGRDAGGNVVDGFPWRRDAFAVPASVEEPVNDVVAGGLRLELRRKAAGGDSSRQLKAVMTWG